MNFNIGAMATQAYSNYSQVQGFSFAASAGSTNPFQAAEQMISQMSQGYSSGFSMQSFNWGASQTLPMPQMANLAGMSGMSGGLSPSNFGQFQPMLQMLGGCVKQLLGGMMQRLMGGMMGGAMGGMMGGMQAMGGAMGGMQGMQGALQTLGQNLGMAQETGMFNSGMMTPTVPGGQAGAGMVNNFINTGNLMGFAAGGFMFNAQIGFSPSQLITETKDKYAGLKTGMGHVNERTNLAQVPEARIALAEIMKKGGNKKFDAVAKELKEKSGIDAKVVTVEGKKGKKAKAIEITTADGRKGKIADGNGNNALDKSDYKFKDAAADVMKQYNLQGLDPKDAVKTIQAMSQPRMGFGMQMMGAQMGGMNMNSISARANNYMDIFSNMFNQNYHNAYGTFQNNNFMGNFSQMPMASNSFHFACTQFAMLTSQAYQYVQPSPAAPTPATGGEMINTANILR